MRIALAPDLWEEVRGAADRAGKSPDDWFAEAAHEMGLPWPPAAEANK